VGDCNKDPRILDLDNRRQKETFPSDLDTSH